MDNTQPPVAPIAEALENINRDIRAAEREFGRHENSVTLLAVSKTKPITAVRAAVSSGQRDFGENYLDEALVKIDQLQDSQCCWHFIGAIQSNKTRHIAGHFAWVHSIDRLKIATRLSEQRPAGLPPLNCCIQLNVDQETTKAGVNPAELGELCGAMQDLPNLRLRGLMVIPATRTVFEEQREIFASVRAQLSALQARWPELDTLSMGMSGDMRAAIAEGSTMVRIGTAIFGQRA